MRQVLFQRAAAAAVLSTGLMTLLLLPPRGSSHEPITTKVMFNKEIVRIFQRHCLACHAEGGIAGIPLSTYEQARPWAKAIKEEILEKRMPPFQAVKGYGRFHRDYALAQRDVDLIVSWVEGGAPKGDDKDIPRELGKEPAWALGPPDLVLRPEEGAKLAAEGEDEYRCFALPTKLKEDRWVAAVEFRPGNAAVAHCASLSVEPPAAASLLKVSAQKAKACESGVNLSAADSLGVWVPGHAVDRWPAGVGRLLPAGSRIVMKVHYRKKGEAASDRSTVGLYFAKEQAVRGLRGVTISAPETAVAAGAARQRVQASYLVNEPAEALAVRPLLFPFGKSVEVTARRPDGTAEVLIWARDYRDDWQPTYHFRKPIALPKGTRVEVTAYLDNSDGNAHNPDSPPRALRFAGPLCALFITQPAPAK